MDQPGEGGPPEDEPPPHGVVGPMWRRTYQRNEGKHGSEPRGRISREPRNGQEALGFSVRVKQTSTARIGIDFDDGDAFVVFRQHEVGEFPERPGQEIFHGYVVAWSDLAQEQKNALLRARLVNLKGKVL